MGRKCSQCGSIGHNSRTCSGYRARLSSPTSSAAAAAVAAPLTGNKGGLRLFGVQLDLSSISTSSSPSHSPSSSSSSRMDNNMKKSFSLDSLSPSHLSTPDDNKISDGYLSDGLTGGFQEKRKGVPWTEEEHRRFLIGLGRLGKGNWRGISRDYVATRTPTQVASHAQKFFLRQSCFDKKKRRSSLFDMVTVRSNGTARNQKPNHPSPPSQPNISPMLSFLGPVNLSQTQRQQSSTIRSETSDVTGPDLELCLAAPSRPLQGRKDSAAEAAGSPFIGPITVAQ